MNFLSFLICLGKLRIKALLCLGLIFYFDTFYLISEIKFTPINPNNKQDEILVFYYYNLERY